MTTPVATKKKVLFIEYCLIIRCFSIGLGLPLQTYHYLLFLGFLLDLRLINNV